MTQTYEDIVRKYYKEMRHNFIDLLMEKYKKSKMRQEDAEDIYQSIFIAIQENLMLGRIKENTSWNSYIMTLGLNMASKHYRKIGKIDSTDETEEDNEDKQSKIARKVDELIKSMSEEEPELYKDPAAQAVLGDELTHTPDPCATIIRLTYYSGLSDAEITEEFDRYNSAKAVKAKRWQCMKDLIYRVKLALYNAGIIDEKPEKEIAAMERIELFDNYILDNLAPDEKIAFDARLKSDRAFANDFKIYLFAIKGIRQEAEQDDMEFAVALKHLSKAQLKEIIGRRSQPRILRISYLRERLAWVSSVAAILIIGFFTVFQVQRHGQYQLYDTIVAYNYVPDYDRSDGDINNYSAKDVNDILPQLENDYANAPSDDIQKCQDTGMRLAMAYLKLHDKDKAVNTLEELAARFHDDEEFSARCNKIISQLK